MQLEHVFQSYVLIISRIRQNQFTKVLGITDVKTHFPVFSMFVKPYIFWIKCLILVSTVNLVTGWERGKTWLKIVHSFLGTRLGKNIYNLFCVKKYTKHFFKLLWWPILWSRNLACGNRKTYMHQGYAICDSKKCQSKPIACQLLFALWVETFKIRTAGGSVKSYHMQIPLSFSRRPCQCASLCLGWSCVSGPCPEQLAPCLGLAVLLSVNSVCVPAPQ